MEYELAVKMIGVKKEFERAKKIIEGDDQIGSRYDWVVETAWRYVDGFAISPKTGNKLYLISENKWNEFMKYLEGFRGHSYWFDEILMCFHEIRKCKVR